MKKLLYPLLALGLLATVSCKDDDNTPAPTPEPMPENAVSYNGKNYTIDNGIIIDWGAWENHYNYDFILTDGVMDLENEIAEGATVFIYVELWAPGTDKFSTGTFDFNDSGDTEGKRYFESVVVVMDTNKNGELDEQDDQLTATDGTFKVSGSGSSYAVEADITLSNSKTLKGSYSGEFDVYEGTIEDESQRRGRMGKPGKRSLRYF